MKTSPSRSVLKRNTQKADAKETTIVWIVANSLSKEYDSNEIRGRDVSPPAMSTTHHKQRKGTFVAELL